MFSNNKYTASSFGDSLEVQKQQRFRESPNDEAVYLLLENDQPKWQWKNENVYPAKFGELSGAGISIKAIQDPSQAKNNHFWFKLDALTIYRELAQDLGKELKEIGFQFGEVRVVNYENNYTQNYSYHANLGLYQEIGD